MSRLQITFFFFFFQSIVVPQVLRCLNGEMQAVIRDAGKCDTTNDGNGEEKSTFLRQPAREIIMRIEKEKLCEVLVASGGQKHQKH